VKVTQVKCPQCDLPIYMRQKDDFFYCSSCGTIHVRGIHGVERIPYEIANFRPGTPLDDCHYIPFWRLQCDFQIKSRSVEGGYLHKLSNALKGGDDGGQLRIFVPASDLDIAVFRYWSVNLTVNNPRYSVRDDFADVQRMPATTGREEAIELADFIAVTLEAEKPGTLQYLDYDLEVQEAKVIYLPFISSPSGLHLAV